MCAIVGIHIIRAGATEAGQRSSPHIAWGGSGGEPVGSLTGVIVLSVGIEKVGSFSIGLPSVTGTLEQAAQIFRGDGGIGRRKIKHLIHAEGGAIRIVIIVFAQIVTALHPDIIGLGRMDAATLIRAGGECAVRSGQHMVIAGAERNLSRIGIVGIDEAVEKRSIGTTKYLLAVTVFILCPVTVFQQNVDHIRDPVGINLRMSSEDAAREAGSEEELFDLRFHWWFFCSVSEKRGQTAGSPRRNQPSHCDNFAMWRFRNKASLKLSKSRFPGTMLRSKENVRPPPFS